MIAIFSQLLVLASAAALPTYSPAQLAELKSQISVACSVAPNVPTGFCGCFAEKSVEDVVVLGPQDRALFLVIAENEGRAGKAQKVAETRLKVPAADFVKAWDGLNAIGAAAGKACMPQSAKP